MNSEQRSKRRRVGRLYHTYCAQGKCIIIGVPFVFLVFMVVLRFPFNTASFQPVLSTHFLYSSVSNSKQQSSFSPTKVGDRVLFPDHVLLFTANAILQPGSADCVYRRYYDGVNGSQPELGFSVRPVLSLDGYDEFRSIVRCPLPGTNFSSVDLRWRGESWGPVSTPDNRTAVSSWDRLVYEAEIDGDTAVLFVKGLNLRSYKNADPSQFRCRFGLENPGGRSEGLVLTTPVISAAQEVVRCTLPRSIQRSPEKAQGIRVTISRSIGNAKSGKTSVLLPSVARIYGSESKKLQNHENEKKHVLCACTMVWNQASALREWIMYHAWLGVERWFIYDNNSDDGIENVVQELNDQGYNITRQIWPWIKSQEAGFSHCALRARDECNWAGFFDVDEFFYLPRAFRNRLGPGFPGKNALGELVANFSSSKTIGEIRTTCRSFGPSGLSSPPPRGVAVGYTCRLKAPERHKSIVRPDLLDVTLLNIVHHFKLREGYAHLNAPVKTAVVNHYKYQVWETFRVKFYRRVSTYVVDWKEDQNKGSKDRAPGLGTEAIEPPDWKLQFCEVWDTGLRDFILAYFADPATGSLPWEERSQAKL